MIRSFKDKRTQKVFAGEPVRELQAVWSTARPSVACGFWTQPIPWKP